MLSISPLELLQSPLVDATLISRQGPRGNTWHHGIDLSYSRNGRSVRGVPILPIAPGVVDMVCHWPENCCGGYGTTVVVEHGDDLYSFYAHMDRADVVEGQEVDWSTPLGIVGDQFADYHDPGCPRLPMVSHLHLEIRHADGSRYDALQVLAAGGVGVGSRQILTRTDPFDYEEPKLAGAIDKQGIGYREVVVGNPAYLGHARGLGLGIAVGLVGLAALGVWLARRKR